MKHFLTTAKESAILKKTSNITDIYNTAAQAKNTSGFTAVEIVIAATLMFSLIAGMLQLLNQGLYQVELARDHNHVTQLMQNEVEELRTQSWNDIVELPGFTSVKSDKNLRKANNKKYYLYRWIIDHGTDQKEVWVYSIWFDSRKRIQTALFRTNFSKNGLNDYYYRAV